MVKFTTLFGGAVISASSIASAAVLPRSPFTRPHAAFDNNGVVAATSPAISIWYDAGSGESTNTNLLHTYTCYEGNPHTKYPPSAKEWLSFENLWKINVAEIRKSEGDENVLKAFKDAIIKASEETKVDKRLILALVMQESTGNVHVAPSWSGNCGILQAHPPCSSYNDLISGGASAVDAIHTMLMEGLQGTSSGYPGLAQALNNGSWKGNPFPGNPYAAARIYNSGSIAETAAGSHGVLDVSVVQGDVVAYANDVANRLMGWNGDVAGCTISATACGLRSMSECV
ncbi:uncharacterized protein K452DRAFT_252781 [Aplosporella prunicola CBS 121167]|uniref:Transglycosylase SLT domain-containing protein n=1 Tax=Aplosporella prunicola CBS 121167 TaxID=1176127 RepID=A0A6A6B7J5_9PEZI|nr:uncharacterized protein K452DRAFT_252781 [Aplosporella prunicola CBS 121167]KAF2140142.1 hypothetical protein K452DRAFT_252781 [Aplosporella prunicola CBS 121167]